MTDRAIVVDANVLIRAVLGTRVPELLVAHAGSVAFIAPERAIAEVREHLPAVLGKRGFAADAIQATTEKLDALERVVRIVPEDVYGEFKARALERIGGRDADDWPVLACALMVNCPVWTEDTDFFGTGVATWSTALVELYLGDRAPDPKAT